MADAQAKKFKIGISWSNFQEDRWKRDEGAIKAALAIAGADYLATDAMTSSAKQITDVEQLIANGCDVVIIIAQDAETIVPSVDRAAAAGVSIIAYDRLIESPNAFYVSFDSREVGRLQATALRAVKPRGDYLFIKGSPSDPNADFLYQGQLEVLANDIASGAIRNVGDSYTDNWLPATAHAKVQDYLHSNQNNLDAIVASNDGMAGGAIEALAEAGLEGKVAVSGQDGTLDGLKRVARGWQTVTVWKDSRALGKRAVDVALALAAGKPPSEIPGTVSFTGGARGVAVNALFQEPLAVTRDNLDIILRAGWIGRKDLCEGVPPTTVKACD